MSVNEQNYVEEAERVIKELKNRKDPKGRTVPMVTTSKLRNLLSMSADIYNEVMRSNEDRLNEELCSQIEYLRVRFLYEAGRDEGVKALVDTSGILLLLKSVNGDKKRYILFNRYVEALVAFHKYYGGKDN